MSASISAFKAFRTGRDVPQPSEVKRQTSLFVTSKAPKGGMLRNQQEAIGERVTEHNVKCDAVASSNRTSDTSTSSWPFTSAAIIAASSPKRMDAARVAQQTRDSLGQPLRIRLTPRSLSRSTLPRPAGRALQSCRANCGARHGTCDALLGPPGQTL